MNVTRAVLPVMRKQRSGQIISISSSAGLVGFEFGSAYAASKYGIEGWMESLAGRGRAVRHHDHHRQPRVLPHRAPLAESTTYARNPVTIWVVRYGDDLYVRSVNGHTSSWFRGTHDRHEGRIWAGGARKGGVSGVK